MQTIPEDIIIKSLQQIANKEERMILNSWLKGNKKNIEYYFQLEEIWYSRKKLSDTVVRDGWSRLAKEIENKPAIVTMPTSLRRGNRSLWFRYAAALFLGVVISSAIWMRFSSSLSESEQHILVQNVIYNRTGVQPVLLPDSSEVWMNENTKFTYPEEFDKNSRTVSLEGNAYFDIRKNPDKPFFVAIGNVEIEVVGTEFFVESDSEGETSVTLVSGSVNLNHKDKEGKSRTTSLLPGQQVHIDKHSGDMKKHTVDTDYYVAWKDGVYRFKDEPLENIARLLARRFDLDIQVSDPIKVKRFTGRVTSTDNIQDVLTTISLSYSIEYQIDGRIVRINEP